MSGELDRAVCCEFEARLAEAVRASATATLDLRRLTFMDSAGYAVLVAAARTSRPEARLVLTGCRGQVRRLLDLVGLPEKVEVRERPMASALGVDAKGSAGIGSEA
ncbi:MAG TPA: STAS domain-containing protein [Solirubrobacterales bacterium]|nr:STAS domain-containing protein [Solirubrobacterales bacterium]